MLLCKKHPAGRHALTKRRSKKRPITDASFRGAAIRLDGGKVFGFGLKGFIGRLTASEGELNCEGFLKEDSVKQTGAGKVGRGRGELEKTTTMVRKRSPKSSYDRLRVTHQSNIK